MSTKELASKFVTVEKIAEGIKYPNASTLPRPASSKIETTWKVSAVPNIAYMPRLILYSQKAGDLRASARVLLSTSISEASELSSGFAPSGSKPHDAGSSRTNISAKIAKTTPTKIASNHKAPRHSKNTIIPARKSGATEKPKETNTPRMPLTSPRRFTNQRSNTFLEQLVRTP